MIEIYGTRWCGDCSRSKRLMDKYSIKYNWTDIDDHPEFQEIVKSINNGRNVVPTIIFPDGSSLSEPSDSELIKKLGV
jgi:glutaredoxin-like protein|tara:strand:+ start:525 stop:758 length:234 start_codon:yes stop_codon:yes gene_type:complete